MSKSIKFTVYCKPQPQGSSRAFMRPGWKHPVITSDNSNLKSFRQEVSKVALVEAQKYRLAHTLNDLPFPKHQPVEMRLMFYFARPQSVPKKRVCHVVKPDLSKIIRAAEDSLTGIVFHDDAQVILIVAEKHYGAPERTEIEVVEI